MKLDNFKDALDYLSKQEMPQTSLDLPGPLWLARAQHLLSQMGNPQNNLKVIHIAGTSGKGSTAYLISQLLTSLGFKTGLTISPHLVDVRERIQISNILIDKRKFAIYLNEIIPFIEKAKDLSFEAPSYFEILIALSFYTFLKEDVDYAVVETGLGGTFDATNTVKRADKIAVITKIGLDHTRTLGETIEKIATQKAGIIHQKNLTLSINQERSVEKIIEKKAKKMGSDLILIEENKNFKNVKVTQNGTYFDFEYDGLTLKNLKLNLLGIYQAENASLALATILSLAKRDGFEVEEEKIRDAFLKAHFIGRMDVIKIKDKTLIIDGAHNTQKMVGLTESLKQIFPNRKFNFLIAFKEEKDFAGMMEKIIPLAEKIFITSFAVFAHQDMTHLSKAPEEIARICEDFNFRNYQIVYDLKEAFKKAMGETKEKLVVTGSLYFIGEIYPLIDDRIL